MGTTLEIASGAAKLSVAKGFIVLSRGEDEQKVPISDIDCLIISSPSVSISSQTISRLAGEAIPIVHCGLNSQPVAISLAYADNVYRKERLEKQIEATEPLKKRLWQMVVRAKIRNQANALCICSREAKDFPALISKTLSGDTGNMEAVAARRYWGRLMGKEFRRDVEAPGINSFLNYGYAILRAAILRSIVGAGLIPDLGIAHHNRMNPFCLADDLMEPYRPYIDLCVRLMLPDEAPALSPDHKRTLISILDIDEVFEERVASLRNCMDSSVRSYVRSLYDKKACIAFPVLSHASHAKMQAIP